MVLGERKVTVFGRLDSAENLDVVSLPDRDGSNDIVEKMHSGSIVQADSESIRVATLDFLLFQQSHKFVAVSGQTSSV